MSLSNLVFCHGHRHLEPKFSKDYTLVDIRPITQPDIVANMLTSNFLSKLPNKSVDKMIFMACPYDVYIHPRFFRLLNKLKIGGSAFILGDWSFAYSINGNEYDPEYPVIDNIQFKVDEEVLEDGSVYKTVQFANWFAPILQAWNRRGLYFNVAMPKEKIMDNKYGIIMQRINAPV